MEAATALGPPQSDHPRLPLPFQQRPHDLTREHAIAHRLARVPLRLQQGAERGGVIPPDFLGLGNLDEVLRAADRSRQILHVHPVSQPQGLDGVTGVQCRGDLVSVDVRKAKR